MHINHVMDADPPAEVDETMSRPEVAGKRIK